ncbi:hypothetical protein [Yeosuana sp.]
MLIIEIEMNLMKFIDVLNALKAKHYWSNLLNPMGWKKNTEVA